MIMVVIGVYFLIKKVVPFSRESKRNTLITKSPIFSDYVSSLRGIVTLRAYGYKEWMVDKMKDKIHDNLRCSFSYLNFIRMFQYYCDLLGAVTIWLNVLILVAMRDSIPKESAGLSLSLSSSMVSLMVWFTRVLVDTENSMTSVERVTNYVQIEPEAAETTSTALAVTDGKVEFKNVSMRYRPHLDPSLR
jgi:ATP-binding cassette subfamily C (CFTR/MRP) protein 4